MSQSLLMRGMVWHGQSEVFKQFVSVWAKLVVKALAMDEEEVCKIKMPARALLSTISKLYSRKIILDQVLASCYC